MRPIEELRPVIQTLYPNGLPIGLAQPLIRICCSLFFPIRERLGKHDPSEPCPPTPDVDKWPIPKKASEAGLTPEEWASYASKVWDEFWSGGPDGTVLTGMGTMTPERHSTILDATKKWSLAEVLKVQPRSCNTGNLDKRPC